MISEYSQCSVNELTSESVKFDNLEISWDLTVIPHTTMNGNVALRFRIGELLPDLPKILLKFEVNAGKLCFNELMSHLALKAL